MAKTYKLIEENGVECLEVIETKEVTTKKSISLEHLQIQKEQTDSLLNEVNKLKEE